MFLKSRQFYCLRVENLEPVPWQELRETLDAGELVYLCGGDLQRVILAGEGIGVHPQLREAAHH